MKFEKVYDHHNASAEWTRRDLQEWLTDVFEAPHLKICEGYTTDVRASQERRQDRMTNQKYIPATAETTEDMCAILDAISFAKSCINFDWNWEIEEINVSKTINGDSMSAVERSEEMMGWFINTTFKRPDINTGEDGVGKGRQLLVRKGWSQSAIFFTCWVAVELIVKHELMEAIRFDGKRVLNPHQPLDELALPDMLKNMKMNRARRKQFRARSVGNNLKPVTEIAGKRVKSVSTTKDGKITTLKTNFNKDRASISRVEGSQKIKENFKGNAGKTTIKDGTTKQSFIGTIKKLRDGLWVSDASVKKDGTRLVIRREIMPDGTEIVHKTVFKRGAATGVETKTTRMPDGKVLLQSVGVTTIPLDDGVFEKIAGTTVVGNATPPKRETPPEQFTPADKLVPLPPPKGTTPPEPPVSR